MSYLTIEQLEKLKILLAKEKATIGRLSGDRFEDILLQVLPDCTKKVVNTRDKKWFDLSQPYRGIEVKTYQISQSRITVGASINNVLKRFGPDLLPPDLTLGDEKDRQVNTNVDASEIGHAILTYLYSSLERHAMEKKINGDFYFAVLLRNKKFNHVGYWEEPIDFGKSTDYSWDWREKSLRGIKDNEIVFTWYYANQRQLFYRFVAPDDVQLIEIPDVKVYVLTEKELQELIAKRG